MCPSCLPLSFHSSTALDFSLFGSAAAPDLGTRTRRTFSSGAFVRDALPSSACARLKSDGSSQRDAQRALLPVLWKDLGEKGDLYFLLKQKKELKKFILFI